jgi:hypothetical protein
MRAPALSSAFCAARSYDLTKLAQNDQFRLPRDFTALRSVQSLRTEELKRTDHDQNTLPQQRYYLARRPDGLGRCLREVFSVGVASRRLAFLLAASQPGGNPASPVSFRFFRSTKSRKVRALKRKDARAGRMRAIDFCRCPPAVEPCRGGARFFPDDSPPGARRCRSKRRNYTATIL